MAEIYVNMLHKALPSAEERGSSDPAILGVYLLPVVVPEQEEGGIRNKAGNGCQTCETLFRFGVEQWAEDDVLPCERKKKVKEREQSPPVRVYRLNMSAKLAFIN